MHKLSNDDKTVIHVSMSLLTFSALALYIESSIMNPIYYTHGEKFISGIISIIMGLLTILSLAFLRTEKEPDYWIEYLPLSCMYVAVYKGEYIEAVHEQCHLVKYPCIKWATKEEAEKHLKKYLEWRGIGLVKLPANI